MMEERVKLFDKEFTYEIEGSVTVLQDEQGNNGKTADEQFAEKCSNYNLPIIARNVLENGESKNLWYEQVLPSETVLYTIIQEEGEELKNALDGKLVQIGANATIGYGYCEFKLIEKEKEQTNK